MNNQRTLRVSNLSFQSAEPYRALAELDFVSYQEQSPEQNARLLHEGKIDLALIPASEFAVYGGYVGLDFGIIGGPMMREIVLLSNVPLTQVDTIFLDPGSSVGVALLRLLLKKRLNFAPKLVRTVTRGILTDPPEGAAILLVGDRAQYWFDSFKHQLDLAQEWWSYTGFPFVCCVWACRPEALNRQLAQTLYDHLFRLSKASLLKSQEGEQYGNFRVIERREIGYHLEPRAREGLDLFLYEASEYSIVPNVRYQSARYSVLDQRPTQKRIERERVCEALEKSAARQRLSIEEGVLLAEKASLPELALAADYVRTKLFPNRSVRSVYKGSLQQIHDNLEQLKALPELSSICIESSSSELSVAEWKRELQNLRATFSTVAITAFNENELEKLAKSERSSIDQVLSGLITSGLTSLRSLDKLCSFELLRSANRFGANSEIILRLEVDHTWLDRVLFLSRIRALQDETPGFRCCSIQAHGAWSAAAYPEAKLRACMIARLFLDNIPHILERDLGKAGLMAVMGLSSGADEVEIIQNASPTELSVLGSMLGVGMDFTQQPIFGPSGGQSGGMVH